MTFQQLTYLVEVSRCGSINKAAHKLFLSQSGISSSIRELENELGICFFRRSNRGVEFTPEGKEFLSYAVSLLEQKQRIESLYSDHGAIAPARFSVSTQRYPFTEDAFLRMVQQTCDEDTFRFSIKEAGMDMVIQDVYEHQVDLGVIFLTDLTEKIIRRMLDAHEVEFHQLASVPPCLYVRKGHPLTGLETVTVADLAGFPYLSFEHDQGAAVDFVRADRNGQLDYGDFERLLRPETKAVVCTHASNLTGDVTDIGFVGEFARRHGLLFILDASQTAGVFPISMEQHHIDVVCFTGHKGLMGPQGTGGLCVGPGVELRPLLVGGTGVQSFSETQPAEYPTRLEAGTLNSHGLAGLGAALEFLEKTGPDTIRHHEQALARRFYEAVWDLPGVRVYGDFSTAERAAIVSLNIGGEDSAEISDQLSERFDIATRPGAHCAPRLHRALGTEDQGAVRFSWGWFNTEAETDAAAKAVQILAEEAR